MTKPTTTTMSVTNAAEIEVLVATLVVASTA
jgi:hypothetical protein